MRSLTWARIQSAGVLIRGGLDTQRDARDACTQREGHVGDGEDSTCQPRAGGLRRNHICQRLDLSSGENTHPLFRPR